MDSCNLISEKKQVMHDLSLPWDESIEREFAAQMKKYPNGNEETTLDRICRAYMQSCFENETESAYKFIKQNHPNEDYLFKHVIIREVGKENFINMAKSNIIKLRSGTSYSI